MQDLLSLGYGSALLLLSSYSNPRSVLRHARAQGYRVADFLLTPLPFGTYSSEPKVGRAGACVRDPWVMQAADGGRLVWPCVYRLSVGSSCSCDTAIGHDSGAATTLFPCTPPLLTPPGSPAHLFAPLQVRAWIAAMRDSGQAFYAGNTYLLAGVLFKKEPAAMMMMTTDAAAQHAASSTNGNGNGNGAGAGAGHGHPHAAAGQAGTSSLPDLSSSLDMVLTSLQ